MATALTASAGHLFVNEWFENDEGGTARPAYVVAPMDLTLVRLHISANSAATGISLVLSKGSTFLGFKSGVNIPSGGTTTVEVEGDSSFGSNLLFRTGEVCNITLPNDAIDYNLMFEFRRSS